MSFEGLLVIDKPKGMTSHDVVSRVRRWLQERRVGHAGTLDPMATGVLLIMVGKTTRLSDYLLNGEKSYRVKVQLGIETNTLDLDGEVIRRHEGVLPTQEEIVSTAVSMSGVLRLRVPEFSAVKIDGQKLYELARRGEEVPVVERDMRFDGVGIEEVGDDFITCRLDCAKGTYIRSWAAELGRRLGCGAAVSELRRLESSPFRIEESIPLDSLLQQDPPLSWEPPRQGIIPLAHVLRDAAELHLSPGETVQMLNGKIPPQAVRMVHHGEAAGQLIRALGPDGSLIAVLEKGPQGGVKIGCVLKPGT